MDSHKQVHRQVSQSAARPAPANWFIAFAPAEDPEIVVAVVVEQAGQGGDIAAPIARELIQVALTEEPAP